VRRSLLALVLVLGSAACTADQEPEIAPATGGGPSTTSSVLRPCPPGGPDATTPAAGCLGEDGAVERP
jgi:hypothetical protein